MKPLHPRDMADATRLTRSGRLSEAVALIQSVLRGRRPNEWPQTDTATSIALPAALLELHAADAAPAVDTPAGATSAPSVLEGVLGRLDVSAGAARAARLARTQDCAR